MIGVSIALTNHQASTHVVWHVFVGERGFEEHLNVSLSRCSTTRVADTLNRHLHQHNARQCSTLQHGASWSFMGAYASGMSAWMDIKHPPERAVWKRAHIAMRLLQPVAHSPAFGGSSNGQLTWEATWWWQHDKKKGVPVTAARILSSLMRNVTK